MPEYDYTPIPVTKTYDRWGTKIHIRFVGTLPIKGAHDLVGRIQGFNTVCIEECDFLSHREPKPIRNAYDDIWSWAAKNPEGGTDLKVQFNCMPIEAFTDEKTAQDYIERVLEPRGYVQW